MRNADGGDAVPPGWLHFYHRPSIAASIATIVGGTASTPSVNWTPRKTPAPRLETVSDIPPKAINCAVSFCSSHALFSAIGFTRVLEAHCLKCYPVITEAPSLGALPLVQRTSENNQFEQRGWIPASLKHATCPKLSVLEVPCTREGGTQPTPHC